MAGKEIHFRCAALAHLTSDECRTLLTDGKKLFELMRLTEEAKALLRFNPKLREAVEKW